MEYERIECPKCGSTDVYYDRFTSLHECGECDFSWEEKK